MIKTTDGGQWVSCYSCTTTLTNLISGTTSQLCPAITSNDLLFVLFIHEQCSLSISSMLSLRPSHRLPWAVKFIQCRARSTALRIPPFDAATISKIQSRLSPTLAPGTPLPGHTVQFTKRPASEAAILIPLMNIDDEPHVLMEVRAANMRSHGGEIA
jgi:hypothetical protein